MVPAARRTLTSGNQFQRFVGYFPSVFFFSSHCKQISDGSDDGSGKAEMCFTKCMKEFHIVLRPVSEPH